MEKHENGKENAIQVTESKQTPAKKDFNQMFQSQEKKIDWAEKAFNIDDLQHSPDEVLSVVIAGVGVVKYGLLTAKEMREFKGITDDFVMSLHVLWKMLQKADPKITYEQIENMDLLSAGVIMKAVMGKDRLFLTSQALKP